MTTLACNQVTAHRRHAAHENLRHTKRSQRFGWSERIAEPVDRGWERSIRTGIALKVSDSRQSSKSRLLKPGSIVAKSLMNRWDSRGKFEQVERVIYPYYWSWFLASQLADNGQLMARRREIHHEDRVNPVRTICLTTHNFEF